MSSPAGEETFRCLVSTPAGVEHCGTALAAARAGGVGILDFEHVVADDEERALANLVDLATRAPGAHIGLRGTAARLHALAGRHPDAIAACGWLIVLDRPALEQGPGSAGPEQEPRPASPQERERAGRERSAAFPGGTQRLLVEVRTIAAAHRVAVDGAFDGVIVCCNEIGGTTGEQSAFMTCQRLAELDGPWYVRGGFGPHGAAACRLAGAGGVVLDDQLLLMPETPLPAGWQRHLDGLDGTECVELGAELGVGCRVLVRPGLAAGRRLAEREQELTGEGTDDARAAWTAVVEDGVGWGDPESFAWPLGHAVGMAAGLRRRHRTTGRLVRAVLDGSLEDLQAARDGGVLAPRGGLATAHGTEFPVVQGPMTRVSDVPEFAAAVAAAGGLPMVALALLRADEAGELLRRTAALLADRPWGVGILGFVPPALRTEQVAIIREVRPPFALIAGGRPDQVAELQADGIDTYVHVPTPGLLPLFLDQGLRRFVFEGRECGGHIGPLFSLQLWEATVAALMRQDPEVLGELRLLFAGGIHDALSAGMVAALTAPLARRGARVGVLMGTAYLFTHEAVATGAIVEDYQATAVACERTVSLVSAIGHANRCAETPFTDEFARERRRLLRSGGGVERVREGLDQLMLGRLRVATKGVERDDGGELEQLDGDARLSRGMYMLGEVAACRSRLLSMRELHREVSAEAQELIEAAAGSGRHDAAVEEGADDIAIVGMSALLPGAVGPEALWRNLLDKRSAIRDLPPQLWDAALYRGDGDDGSVSTRGGFIDDFPFDPLDFGIPPNSMPTISPAHLMALWLTRAALADAGWEAGTFDREHTAVIVGTTDAGGMHHHLLLTRSNLRLAAPELDAGTLDRLPAWSQESFTGALGNIVAGRVANRFDLGGPNLVVDSACASSLTALDIAVQELRDGRSNVVIAGGIDVTQTPYTYLAFSNTQALSPGGEVRTFDRKADGIVISDGGAMLVLKRLADAERDGDRIHAVIKGVGASSDGRALGMTAPRPLGQQRALRRAYGRAGFSPATLSLYEAHGTGTKVGDEAELETVGTVLREAGAAPKSVAVGSAKTLLGHTKTAAGVVGLLKCVEALRRQVLPPHAGVDEPLEQLGEDDAPVCLLDQAVPWLDNRECPRRAAVSAFGFGGTNAHVVLEEYRGAVPSPPPGGADRPAELFVFGAASEDALRARLGAVRAALDDGAAPPLRELAASCAREADAGGAVAALVAGSIEELRTGLGRALAGLEQATGGDAPGVRLRRRPAQAAGKLALLFPGQASQQVGMLREAALYLPELRVALEHADDVLGDDLGEPLSRFVYPPAAFDDAARRRAERRLTDTRVAQPALGAVCSGLFDFCAGLGIAGDMAGGHSYGELVALYAAGDWDRERLLRMSWRRGAAMAAIAEPGAMAAVQAGPGRLEGMLVDGVVIANENAPDQTVIAGPPEAVRAVLARFGAAAIPAVELPVSAAFHSPAMAPAAEAFADALSEDFRDAGRSRDATHRWTATGANDRATAPRRDSAVPRIAVYSNADGRRLPRQDDEINTRLTANITGEVSFARQIRAMYEDGARVFIEVGPGAVLTRLVGSNLAGEPHTAIALDGRGGSLSGVLDALARLLVAGVPMRLERLFAGRVETSASVDELFEEARPQPTSPTTWLVNGLQARPLGAEARVYGTEPLLDAASTAATATARGDGSVADAGSATLTGAGEGATQRAASRGEVDAGAEPARAESYKLRAWEAYQRTMRQFLRTQERIVAALLEPDGAPGETAGDQLRRSIPAPPISSDADVFEAFPGADGAGQGQSGPNSISPPSVDEADAGTARKGQVDRPPAGDAPVALQPEALRRLLVELVADRTGYPPEMLGADLDIEAELGVDSIKRLEVLDRFLKRLPGPLAAALGADMDRIGRAKTLDAVVEATLAKAEESETGAAADGGSGEGAVDDVIEPAAGADALTPAHGAAATNAADPGLDAADTPIDAAAHACPRFVVRMREEPLAGVEFGGLSGQFLITDDGGEVAAAVGRELEERGVIVARAPLALCSDPEALHAWARAQAQRNGTVRGVVHLAGLGPTPMPEDFRAWRESTQRGAKALFTIVRAALDDLRRDDHPTPPRVVAASRLGGLHGRGDGPMDASPAAGAGVGLLHTLALELPGVLCKALDFDRAMDDDRVGRAIVDELRFAGGAIEVGYRDAVRHAVAVEHRPATRGAGDSGKLRRGEVALVTGGASGITAAALQSIAVDGASLIIVGRTVLQEEPPASRAQPDAAGLRRWMLQQAQARGEAPTPADVEMRVRAVLHRRAVRDNLARLSATGARIDYRAVDVRDHDAFGALIESVYERHGRIDVVVHGAGVIEDRLLGDKSRASFDRVFDTKVDAGFTLLRRLRPRGLRFVALFSSTAGRFGNRGQADYAAANEVLNRLGWQMHRRWPDTRVVAINWGPWSGAGMASDAVNQRFVEQGIVPIPVAAGSDFLADEMAARCHGEVEIVAGHGPWEQGGTLQRGARRLGSLFDLGGVLLHAGGEAPGEVQ